MSATRLILAVCEQRDGTLRKLSHEVVTGARRIGETVEAVVCASGPVAGADQLGLIAAASVIPAAGAAAGRNGGPQRREWAWEIEAIGIAVLAIAWSWAVLV